MKNLRISLLLICLCFIALFKPIFSMLEEEQQKKQQFDKSQSDFPIDPSVLAEMLNSSINPSKLEERVPTPRPHDDLAGFCLDGDDKGYQACMREKVEKREEERRNRFCGASNIHNENAASYEQADNQINLFLNAVYSAYYFKKSILGEDKVNIFQIVRDQVKQFVERNLTSNRPMLIETHKRMLSLIKELLNGNISHIACKNASFRTIETNLNLLENLGIITKFLTDADEVGLNFIAELLLYSIAHMNRFLYPNLYRLTAPIFYLGTVNLDAYCKLWLCEKLLIEECINPSRGRNLAFDSHIGFDQFCNTLQSENLKIECFNSVKDFKLTVEQIRGVINAQMESASSFTYFTYKMGSKLAAEMFLYIVLNFIVGEVLYFNPLLPMKLEEVNEISIGVAVGLAFNLLQRDDFYSSCLNILTHGCTVFN